MVAFWHTHGDRDVRNRFFSPIDADLVRTWQRPFYLADYTGLLKVLRPGQPVMSAFRARKAGLPAWHGIASGTIVRTGDGNPVLVTRR